MTNKEAIPRLKEEIELYTPYAKTWNDARLDIEALEMAIQALEQTQWIPVSERLPETDDEVLVTADNGEIYLGFIYKYGSKEWYMVGEYHELIAWMPLPKPYEPQKNCDTCKHKDDGWDSEHCDGCCGNHSGIEPQGSEDKG